MLVLFGALVVGDAGARVSAGPIVDAISPPSSPRSGRVVVTGSGFGTQPGTVRIAGLAASSTRWTDTRIVAYVPEAAPVGEATLTVESANGSASAPIGVTERPASNGRVLWRFQMDAPYALPRPAIGADGTVYVHDVSGFLYALTPDGGLKWIYRGPGGADGTTDVGPDGTIYIGGGWGIDAVNPDGTRKWRFSDPDSQGLIAGPNVGPDGNVYAVMDLLGMGALSLTPGGQLRWTNPGQPRFSENGQLSQEIVFGSGMLYVTFDASTQSEQPKLYGLDLDGNQRFAVDRGGGTESAQLGIGLEGNVYFAGGTAKSLHAFGPTGNPLWTFYEFPGNTMEPADAGPDRTVYTVRNLSTLHAFTPAGNEKWRHVDQGILKAPVVSPANDLVLMGGQVTYGQPGFVKAFGTDGTPLWQLDIPNENGFCLVPNARPRFRPDASAAYIAVWRLCQSQDEEFSYLYAISTGDAQPPPDTVTITRATYRGSRDRLRIDATSTSSTATLKAYVTSSDALIGTLTNLGGGSYTSTFRWPSNPKQVTVRSSQGGSATAPVRRG